MNTGSWEHCQQVADQLAATAAARWPAPQGRTPNTQWLGDAVRRLAVAAPTWERMQGTRPTERSYRRVIATPELEAWLIYWPHGGRLQLHDHGGARGAFEVVSGQLLERYVLRRTSASARKGFGGALGLHLRLPATQRRLGEGTRVAFGREYIHDVANVNVAAATSVHVYTAALRPMAFYGPDGTVTAAYSGDSVMSSEVGGEHALLAGPRLSVLSGQPG